jgi:hypothetical protein
MNEGHEDDWYEKVLELKLERSLGDEDTFLIATDENGKRHLVAWITEQGYLELSSLSNRESEATGLKTDAEGQIYVLGVTPEEE